MQLPCIFSAKFRGYPASITALTIGLCLSCDYSWVVPEAMASRWGVWGRGWLLESRELYKADLISETHVGQVARLSGRSEAQITDRTSCRWTDTRRGRGYPGIELEALTRRLSRVPKSRVQSRDRYGLATPEGIEPPTLSSED